MKSRRMARPLPALVVTVIAGVLAGSLGHAPAAVAAPPQPAKAKGEVCERVGDSTSKKAHCVTLRIVGDSSTDVGEDIRVAGTVHESKRHEKTRVVIERAIDGGTWHDHGKRWTKVTTVDVGPSGRFATDVTVHRRGLHTLRARVIDPSGKGNAQSAAPKTRSVDFRDSGGDSVSDSVQATGGHMGSAVAIEVVVKSRTLKVQCLAMGGGQVAWTAPMPLPATCAFVGDQSIPSVAGLFRLVDGTDVYATPSADERFTSKPTCSGDNLGVQKEGTVAHVEITEPDFGQTAGYGYAVKKTYLKEGASELTTCNYFLFTKREADFFSQPTWAIVAEAGAALLAVATIGLEVLGALGVFGSTAVVVETGEAVAGGGELEAGVQGFDGAAERFGGVIEEAGIDQTQAWADLENNWGNGLNTVRFGPLVDADAAEAGQMTEEELEDKILGNDVEYVGYEYAKTLQAVWMD